VRVYARRAIRSRDKISFALGGRCREVWLKTVKSVSSDTDFLPMLGMAYPHISFCKWTLVFSTAVGKILVEVEYCHGNFGPPKILVRGTKISGKLVRRTIIFGGPKTERTWLHVLLVSIANGCMIIDNRPGCMIIDNRPVWGLYKTRMYSKYSTSSLCKRLDCQPASVMSLWLLE